MEVYGFHHLKSLAREKNPTIQMLQNSAYIFPTWISDSLVAESIVLKGFNEGLTEKGARL